MLLKTDLRENSYYFLDEKLYKHVYSNDLELRHGTTHYFDISGIPFTDSLFYRIKSFLRPFFDYSAGLGGNITLFRFPEDEFYWLTVEGTRIKEIVYLHELQNILHDIYDKEIELNNEQLILWTEIN